MGPTNTCHRLSEVVEAVSIEAILPAVYQAGEAIMDVYATDFDVEYKDDKSPLTLADQRSNAVIVAALEKLYPHIPILSEESKSVAYADRKDWQHLWLVDPLDGTKEFVKKNGEFTINIALVENGLPVLGIVYAPAKDELFYAKAGKGAYKVSTKGEPPQPITGIPAPTGGTIRLMGSRSHGSDAMQAYVAKLEANFDNIETYPAGSAFKFCWVAEGKADQYPRFGPTMEWDTAAGHAIVRECGKDLFLTDADGILTYNKESLLNPFFICR